METVYSYLTQTLPHQFANATTSLSAIAGPTRGIPVFRRDEGVIYQFHRASDSWKNPETKEKVCVHGRDTFPLAAVLQRDQVSPSVYM